MHLSWLYLRENWFWKTYKKNGHIPYNWKLALLTYYVSGTSILCWQYPIRLWPRYWKFPDRFAEQLIRPGNPKFKLINVTIQYIANCNYNGLLSKFNQVHCVVRRFWNQFLMYWTVNSETTKQYNWEKINDHYMMDERGLMIGKKKE